MEVFQFQYFLYIYKYLKKVLFYIIKYIKGLGETMNTYQIVMILI